MAPDADSDQARAAQQRCEEQGEHAGVLARMEALHAQRSPLYSEVATLTVPTDGLSLQQVAALILVALGGPDLSGSQCPGSHGRDADRLARCPLTEPPTARSKGEALEVAISFDES